MIALERMPCAEGVIRGAAEAQGCAERAKPWVLATTILGSSLAFIDSSVVTVALPTIQRSGHPRDRRNCSGVFQPAGGAGFCYHPGQPPTSQHGGMVEHRKVGGSRPAAVLACDAGEPATALSSARPLIEGEKQQSGRAS